MIKDTNLNKTEVDTNKLYNKQKLLKQIENSPSYKRYNIEYDKFRNIVSISTVIIFSLLSALNFIYRDFTVLIFIVFLYLYFFYLLY